jgi:DNA-binding response OmpR family regulator
MASDLTNTLVLIEDNELIAASVTYIVETYGFSIETAGDMQSGLSLIRRVRPKVVLLDVELRDGSGVELCSAVRSEPAIDEAVFLLLGTHDPETLCAIAEEVGAYGYLCKPFDPDLLLGLVRHALALGDSLESAFL